MPTITAAELNDVQQRNDQALADLQARFASVTNSVSVARVDWRALMESGALASLSVSRYRGTRALSAGDLGLDQTEVDQVSDLVALGHRLILPKQVLNQFNSVETRARQIVRSAGLLTPLGLFVPAAAYAKLASAIGTYKARFDDLVSDLLAALPVHRDTMIRDYALLADHVYNRLDRAGLTLLGRAEFTTRFVDRCLATFPTPDELARSFKFELRLQFVPLPYQTQTETPDYAAATDDLLELRRAVLADQQAARQREIADFMTSVQTEVYTLVNDALTDVLAALDTNGSMQGRSITQLSNLVERLTDLNFWQDNTLTQLSAEIMAIMRRPVGATQQRRDTEIDRALLVELQTITRQRLLAIGDDTYAGLAVETLPAAPAPALLPTDDDIAPALLAGSRQRQITAAVPADQLF